MQATRIVVKIAVVGDAGCGKTSLISTAANDTFDARPAPVLPPTRLPGESTPDHVPMVVTDTSSRPEDQQVVDLVLQHSDVVVVCFDATRQVTLDSIRTHWYGRIQNLNPGVPVIMACCKADRLVEEREVNMLRERVEQSVHDLPHVEVCLNCSAKTLRMVADVFYYALKSVLYPLQPLYDRLEKRLRPLCVRALKRVFVMCDEDGDGALKDSELNAFQLACFGMALDPEELQNVKQIVASKMPAGVTSRGITLEGFLFLHVLFIERGRLESTWAVLRKFGYNDFVQLSDEVLDKVNFTYTPDHVWELSDAALGFLLRKFESVDEDRDRLISWQQLDSLFSTIPPPAWQGEPWTHLLVPGMSGSAHNLEAFLLKWQVHTLMDPRTAYAHLLYLGYGGPDGSGGPALLARGTRRKSDKRHRAELAARTTVQCLVFGPRGCGKTALLRALVGLRPEGVPTSVTSSPSTHAPAHAPPEEWGSPPTPSITHVAAPATSEAAAQSTSSAEEVVKAVLPDASWSAVALVKGPDDKERTLVMQEVDAEQESRLLTAAALAAHGATPLVAGQAPGGGVGPPGLDLARADVAAFVFDCSNPASFRQTMDLLVQVSTYAGDTLPCVVVATKDELVMGAALESALASALAELQLVGCVRTSAQQGEMNGVFSTLVSAAVSPDGWIPETPARKAHRRFVRQVITGTVAGAVTAGLVYCAYRFMSASSSAPQATTPTASASAPSSTTTALPTSSNTARSSIGTSSSAATQPSSNLMQSRAVSGLSDVGGSSGQSSWSFPSSIEELFQMFSSMFEAAGGAVASAVHSVPGDKGASETVRAHSVSEACRSGAGRSVADRLAEADGQGMEAAGWLQGWQNGGTDCQGEAGCQGAGTCHTWQEHVQLVPGQYQTGVREGVCDDMSALHSRQRQGEATAGAASYWAWLARACAVGLPVAARLLLEA